MLLCVVVASAILALAEPSRSAVFASIQRDAGGDALVAGSPERTLLKAAIMSLSGLAVSHDGERLALLRITHPVDEPPNPSAPHGTSDQIVVVPTVGGPATAFRTTGDGDWMSVQWNPRNDTLLAVQASGTPIPDWMGNDTLWLLGPGSAKRKIADLDSPCADWPFPARGRPSST